MQSQAPTASEFQLPTTTNAPIFSWDQPAVGYSVTQTLASSSTQTATGASPAVDDEVCQLASSIGGTPYIQVTSTARIGCAGNLATGPITVEVCPQVFEAGGIGWQNIFCGTTKTLGGVGAYTHSYGPYDAACDTSHEYRTWAWDDIPELVPSTVVAISPNRYCSG